MSSNMFESVRELVNTAVSISSGSSTTNILMKLMSIGPRLVADIALIISSYKSDNPEDKKNLIDSALLEVDMATGVEGASVIPNMQMHMEAQEKALDHLNEFLRLVLYAQFGVLPNRTVDAN